VKQLVSKAQKRALLEQEMEKYLAKGGAVEEVEQGISGRENPMKALLPVLFNEKVLKRTDARAELKKVDDRKHPKKRPTVIKAKLRKKIPVYDDFGEVLRWVWNDESPSLKD
jgi:hypothetical protein